MLVVELNSLWKGILYVLSGFLQNNVVVVCLPHAVFLVPPCTTINRAGVTWISS